MGYYCTPQGLSAQGIFFFIIWDLLNTSIEQFWGGAAIPYLAAGVDCQITPNCHPIGVQWSPGYACMAYTLNFIIPNSSNMKYMTANLLISV